MPSGCSLVILAGGRSRRMGRDKAGLPAGDRTLIEHLAHRLRPVVDETIVAGGSASLELAGVRRIDDRQPGMGTLPVCMPASLPPGTRWSGWLPVTCPMSSRRWER